MTRTSAERDLAGLSFKISGRARVPKPEKLIAHAKNAELGRIPARVLFQGTTALPLAEFSDEGLTYADTCPGRYNRFGYGMRA